MESTKLFSQRTFYYICLLNVICIGWLFRSVFSQNDIFSTFQSLPCQKKKKELNICMNENEE